MPDWVAPTQAGNINSGACDPIGTISELTREAGAWLHVDGAFGLWAATSPTTSHLLTGYENADSWVADCHKWLNTPYDCGITNCRHRLTCPGINLIAKLFSGDIVGFIFIDPLDAICHINFGIKVIQ